MHYFHMIHDLVFHPFCALPERGLALCRLQHQDGGWQDIEVVKIWRAKTTWFLLVLIMALCLVYGVVTAARYDPCHLIDYSRFGNWECPRDLRQSVCSATCPVATRQFQGYSKRRLIFHASVTYHSA